MDRDALRDDVDCSVHVVVTGGEVGEGAVRRVEYPLSSPLLGGGAALGGGKKC